MTEFKFSARSRALIENFSRINLAMVFRQDNILRTCSPEEDVIAFAEIAEKIPSKFAVYDLSKFLGIMDLYENPSIKVNEKTLTIESSGRKFMYVLAAEQRILAPGEDSKTKLLKYLTENPI